MARPDDKKESSGQFAFAGLERAIHEKARLGILSSLVSHSDGLFFSDLKELCDLTDGNLNRHLKVLQEEGLVLVSKSDRKSRQRTLCQMTSEGRERFASYLSVLEQVVRDAAQASSAAEDAPPREGWSPA